MLELKITITAPDLAAAISNLAAAIEGSKGRTKAKADPTAKTPVPPVQEQAPLNEAPAPAAPQVPTSVAPAPVPTSAPQYTLDMIATAGSALIDAGKMDQLMQLLGKFGVASLTELAPEHYGALAGELRALGAAI